MENATPHRGTFRTEAVIDVGRVAAALLLLLACFLIVPRASAQATGTCAAATGQGSNGPPDWASYCWVNFSGYNDGTAHNANGQAFSITLAGGGTMTFRLRVTGAAMQSVTVPSWTGAAFGQTAFTGVPGRPVLYNAANGTSATVTLSQINVTVGGGQVPYAFVIADAESSNNGESLVLTTNGTPWTLLATMPNGSSPLFPTYAFSGPGGTTATVTGAAGTVGAYAFASEGSPTVLTAQVNGGGLQGIAFGVKYRAADLQITSSHSGSGFPRGGTGSYTLTVKNNGPDAYSAANTITVTDTLPAGLTYVPAGSGGTGWSCSAAGQVVTCTRSGTVADGATLPAITLNVNVSSGAPASVTNNASVSVLNGYDFNSGNNSTSLVTPILSPNLSGSTKNVVDLNGGDANPGDTLRYSITLVESAGVAASNVTFTDNRPANTTFGGALNAATTCSGTDTSTATLARMTGVSVPAGGSCTIVFDVAINAGVTPGTTIDNTATITPASGNGATPAAPTVVVSQSAIAASGNKLLYVYDNLQLTRTPQPTTNMSGVTIGSGGNNTWTLAPAIAAGKSLVLAGGQQVAVNLRIRCTGGFWCGWGNQSTSVELRRGTTVLGTSSGQNVTNEDFALRTFTINLASGQTIGEGQTLSIRVINGGGGFFPQSIAVSQYNGGRSTVAFDTSTVVNVDTVTAYSAAYPSTATKAQYVQGDTVYIRAVISDPFGGHDVSGARLRLTDAAGTVLLNEVPMAPMTTGAGGATRIFEGSYTIPANPRIGVWNARVTGIEGTELDGGGNPAVTHVRNQAVPVHGVVTLGKIWSGATAGNAVSLTISGGSSATAGSSTAPSTTTAATATAPPSASLALTEAFTSGSADNYLEVLACTRARDSVAVPVTGMGLGRSIVMPNDSAVTCTWSNTWTVPLTLVKYSVVVSDPVNGTSNPKAIPGAVVEYEIIVTNPAANPIDAGTVFVTDMIPANTRLRVADIAGAGSGPVSFTNGTPGSGLTYSFTSLASGSDDIAFSNNGGATWTYVPVADPDGYDAAVDAIRVNPKGVFNPNNAQFTLRFRVRID